MSPAVQTIFAISIAAIAAIAIGVTTWYVSPSFRDYLRRLLGRAPDED